MTLLTSERVNNVLNSLDRQVQECVGGGSEGKGGEGETWGKERIKDYWGRSLLSAILQRCVPGVVSLFSFIVMFTAFRHKTDALVWVCGCLSLCPSVSVCSCVWDFLFFGLCLSPCLDGRPGNPQAIFLSPILFSPLHRSGLICINLTTDVSLTVSVLTAF